MAKLIVLVFLLAFVFGNVCTASDSGETGYGRHPRMFALPAPGPVTIDGKLDDWDLSGRVEAYITAALRGVREGAFALMYDGEALYVAGDILDDSPMVNRHSPEGAGNKAWDADSVQFRICVDPGLGYPVVEDKRTPDAEAEDALVHMLFWYYTDREEPNLQLHTSMKYHEPEQAGKFGVMPKDSFQAAYVKKADGTGYTFEYRLPWQTLGAPRPLRAGDVVPGTFQLNWGQPTGLIIIRRGGYTYDVLHPEAPGGRTYQTSAGWGKIVFAAEGHLDRALTEPAAAPAEPTPLTFAFELPADGEVTVTLFDEENVAVRTLLASAPRAAGRLEIDWDGLDELGAPLPAGAYTWKGLVHDPITTHFVLSVNNSGNPPYKTDDYTGGWGSDHGVPTSVLATGEGLILGWNHPETGSGQIGVSREGQRRWGTRNGAEFLALAADGKRYFSCGGAGFQRGNGVRVYAVKDGRSLAFGNGSGVLKSPGSGEEEGAAETGLAASKGTLYVAYRALDQVALFDSQSGALRTTWTVPRPGALALAADGALLVVSGQTVLKLRDGDATPFLAEFLDDPRGIAVGPDGAVYVSNGGALQQVSLFTPEGDFARAIGKAGGRPRVGAFDGAGMLEPTGLAVDSQGRLWVAEKTQLVKRHSVWDTETGALVDDFFGGADYSSLTWVDPERPEEIYNGGVVWQVDYETKRWRPKSTVWSSRDPNALGDARRDLRVFTAKNGRQFAWHLSSGQSFLLYRDGDVFKPFAALLWPGRDGGFPALKAAMERDGGKATYAWQDRNGDQTLQADELVAIGSPGLRGFSWVDADLTIWHGKSGPHVLEEVKRGRRVRKLWRQKTPGSALWRPVSFLPDGIPVYDFTQAEQTPVRGNNVQGPFSVDPQDGSLYASRPQDTRRGRAWNHQAIDWGRYRPDGTLLWGYKGAWSWKGALALPPQRPGKLWGPTCPIPPCGDFHGFSTYFGTYHLYTRDGLCVAMLMRDPREKPGFGPDVNACETWNGRLFRHKEDGKWYLLHGDQDGRVQEVRGLETVKRLAGGTFVITPEDCEKVRKARAAYAAAAAQAQRLVIVRGRKALDLAQGVERQGTGAQAFTARAAYDEKNLYLKLEVQSPFPLENRTAQPQLIFKGGNLIDLQLATDPKAPVDRTQAAPGDLRLLISRRDDNPVAVLYRTKVAGFTGNPIVLSSPTGTESFDQIEEVGDQIGLAVRLRKSGDGCAAIATIPLDLLGWTPRAQTSVKLDVGYIFGNDGGTQAMRRLYWTNNSFSANVLNDVPNESRLEPHKWGTAEVE